MAIEAPHQKKWISLCTEDKIATFYHTPEWYATAQSYLSCKIELILIGENTILPTIKYRKGLRRRWVYESSPFGTYGGLLGDKHIEQVILLKALNNKRIFIRKNPYDKTTSIDGLKTEKEEFTQLIQIPEQKEKITENWSVNHKRNLKKALQNKLVFEVDNSPNAVNRYFSLYKQSLHRWGKNNKNKHQKKIFSIISKICVDHVSFCFVSKDNIDLSGGIFFFWNNRVHYWSGASNQQGLSLFAPVFMFFNVLMQASAEGLHTLDLNPSNHLEGVISFKSKFGANKLNCSVKSFGFN